MKAQYTKEQREQLVASLKEATTDTLKSLSKGLDKVDVEDNTALFSISNQLSESGKIIHDIALALAKDSQLEIN